LDQALRGSGRAEGTAFEELATSKRFVERLAVERLLALAALLPSFR